MSYSKNNMLFKNVLNFKKNIPSHVAIIMDGNGKWARKRGKSRFFGHFSGFYAARRAISFALFHKLKILTLYAFSSDNWNRSPREIKVLMELFFYALSNETNNLNKYNIRLKVIGNKEKFNTVLKNKIRVVEKETLKNTGLLLNIAANYSGRWEILEAIKKIVVAIKCKNLSLNAITESTVSDFLLINEKIPVDLVIRTGGECRLSNFLVWQISYSELYFTNTLWPDFDRKEFKKAIDEFSNRERRFGRVSH
ncbi:undecaprenyl pyrophosphate synthetase [Buchnera aphidicola str. Bp (Baizongia pistaciae)]|uniref:Ditrans,polycis-undecaprenyl-diphosphate synthase ((2E,6E)-farnesyl-diphosphate specific) n=1 Tax=Buchnera aphidicola subsp. Baizongia pistaciae (strain Bp) TaxID=224915 RepID=UPPS_BUCBP|nr:polyprenyl diphosphate synthase [Buchnera aphidicola]Q89AP0.1 RecName: Full=Ditrans,polycis-undecaprenyl-diphosphate synthase ((2E,6E)-farnesyl-diphosphate specific); AltName: Full=Ditrans,polycis-undecaprenylcistransferase; AltName: Full=Undecaprenyl diphosphate synthase; Short=UDS; AltName: Full=Undecaprenyl pyrophosphate synthase; Short=UPP synthase [Buchnera aphidicola str. Bp (Baizongia pistaciae)]AAO26949.1 undecaprenyl pyrophosphate synthetase [Buchnera aphidicola str. Bp (Baizongia pis